MTVRKTTRRRVDGAQDAVQSTIPVERKTVPSPNASSGNSLTVPNPRISFGPYRILGNEIWEGEWRRGYQKVADIDLTDRKLTVIKTYAKIPSVYLRKLQELINGKS